MKPPTLKSLKLKEIEIADLQARAGTDDKTIAEYAEAFTEGAKFPAATVFHDGKRYFLADGFHRYFGAQKAGLADILCDIKSGTRADALWFAAGANKTHGLKRSNLDKRHAVELALREKPGMTDNAIAKHVGVSFPLVQEIRSHLQVLEPELNPLKRTGTDGKQYPAPPSRLPVPQISASHLRVLEGGTKLPPPPPAAKKAPPAPPLPRKEEPVVVVDKTGWPIPAALIPTWERSHEVQEILTSLSRIKGALRSAQDGKDKLFVEVNFSTALAQLDQAYADIKTAIPFAVCPTCQGKTPDNCGLCKGRGFVSEHRWSTVVSKETKELRFKVKK